MHLLIVEDSPDLQRLLAQLFVAEGYTLSQAYDGQQALDLLRQMDKAPELILLDLMMPRMDGLAFREAQVRDARLAAIPVLVMSADTTARTRVSELGIKGFISKPILDIDELFTAVERAVRVG